MSRSKKPPKYRHYKPKNLGVVRLNGKDIYLGEFDSPESWELYHRLIAEWLANTPAPSPVNEDDQGQTVNQVINAYRKFAETYYVKNGETTKEFVEMKYAARPVRKLYGRMPATNFGPTVLKAVREHMIDEEELSRGVINQRLNRIRRISKWAVSEELIPPSIYEGLRTVDGLRYGRTRARETDPVKPLLREHVEPILETVSSPVAAMIELQWLTAMRPGEVVLMRACDINMSEDIWVYEPYDHKNRWRNHQRLIPLGPQAQAIVKPFLTMETDAFLFSPQQADREWSVKRRKARKTPLTPSQRTRKPKPYPKRPKRDHYDVAAYRRAITYGIKKVNRVRETGEKITPWFPLQLRHNRTLSHVAGVIHGVRPHRARTKCFWSADVLELAERLMDASYNLWCLVFFEVLILNCT